MPNGSPRGTEAETYQWVHIDDFSPGLYDGSHISTETPTVAAPLGAADATATYCCASINGGALGPLPMLTTTTSFTTIMGNLPGSSTTALIAGFSVTPQLSDGNYELVTTYEADDGTNHYVKSVSYEPAIGTPHTITGPTSTNTTTGGFFGAPYPVFTRMTSSGSGNPPPVLVFPTAVSTDSAGASGHLWVYPELLSPTSYIAQDLIVSHSSTTGQTIAYGSRILVLAGITYSWPTGSGVNTNENINFTDPPLSSTFGNQETVLGAETPWGYGAWGSVSVGELLLIKKYGGAVILYGDILNPSAVVEVPGVESTGNFVGSASSTPTGLYYCSQNRGAWVWNGGNTSTKISRNISDRFFDLETGNIGSNNYGFFAYHWQKWVLFSNNLIYDTETGGWWKLFPNKGTNASPLPNGRNLFWYSLTQNGNQMVTAPLQVSANSDPLVSLFDNTVGSQLYQWQSLPIHVIKDADRVLDVRRVSVRASDPAASGTGTVTVTINGQSVGTSSGITIGSAPTDIVLNAGVNGLQDIVVKLVAQNSASGQPAPIIHSIDIAYQIRAEVKANN